MNIDNFFQILYLLLLAAGGFGIGKLFQNSKGSERLAFLQRIVMMVVEAVEQTAYLQSASKKEQAINKVREILARYKINLSFEELDALIEQAVLHMNLKSGRLPRQE